MECIIRKLKQMDNLKNNHNGIHAGGCGKGWEETRSDHVKGLDIWQRVDNKRSGNGVIFGNSLHFGIFRGLNNLFGISCASSRVVAVVVEQVVEDCS